ncbi:hypothetical protein JOF48_001076 [Arthrobacter stackebrandtii]|uniref:Uncharacterized protein n=1 Tax=Arthrobacter stackebrandtii TaxID=272161 RepID=A0ABS4YU11_9MICC|nr:hypothetical protein [Arthrobacter stackebrandtii]MBP2412277.1 hypothetical protein [Arthrobacter stackebrandtii]PYH02060.1 hypothetical protein CVV67_01040 [Arthrobacter stackebrandtii]
MSQSQLFLSIDHRVVGVEVHAGDESAHDLMWEVSYGERDAEESARYALGWLHGAGEGVQVTVSVGALVVDTGIPYADEDFSRLFGASDACEALYEYARMAGSVAISLTRETLELPAYMPLVQVEPFPDDDDEQVPD